MYYGQVNHRSNSYWKYVFYVGKINDSYFEGLVKTSKASSPFCLHITKFYFIKELNHENNITSN